MKNNRALLIHVNSTHEYDDIPSHGLLPITPELMQHYLQLLDSTRNIGLPDLESISFHDFNFQLLKETFFTEEDIQTAFGEGYDILQEQRLQPLLVTDVQHPTDEYLDANSERTEFIRLHVDQHDNLYFSGFIKNTDVTWESHPLTRNDLQELLATRFGQPAPEAQTNPHLAVQ